MRHYWGATIIAAVIYFILSFLSDVWFTRTTSTNLALLLTAGVKAGIFAVIFHYVHGFIAGFFGFYESDPELDARAPASEEQ